MWQWIKHESRISFRSQIGSQLSEQQHVKAVQSNQKRNHQQASFVPQYFGMLRVFAFFDYFEKGRTINIL